MFSGGLAKLLPQKGDFRPASFGWAIAGGAIASLKLDSGLARFAKEKLAEYKELCANAERDTTPLCLINALREK